MSTLVNELVHIAAQARLDHPQTCERCGAAIPGPLKYARGTRVGVISTDSRSIASYEVREQTAVTPPDCAVVPV